MDNLLISFYAQLAGPMVSFRDLNKSLLLCIESMKTKRTAGKLDLEIWLVNRTSISKSLLEIHNFYVEVKIRSFYFDFLEAQINGYYSDHNLNWLNSAQEKNGGRKVEIAQKNFTD